ncbi:MAG: hypothetical protein VCF25_19080 [Candidatus Poribacteria bacterium]
MGNPSIESSIPHVLEDKQQAKGKPLQKDRVWLGCACDFDSLYRVYHQLDRTDM